MQLNSSGLLRGGPFESRTAEFSGQEDADPDIPILKEAKAEFAKLEWLVGAGG